MKICGHGTILALMDNRKARTVSLIQPTVLVFLVIRSKYCFMEPLPCEPVLFLSAEVHPGYEQKSIRRLQKRAADAGHSVFSAGSAGRSARPYSTVMRRIFSASSGVSSPGSRRHCQLPLWVPGVFIR